MAHSPVSLEPLTLHRLEVPTANDFLHVERRLDADFVAEIDLYAALYDSAMRLVKGDAFYVCLIQRSPDWLHFVYNCEGEHFDKPEPFRFGDGPTSWVAREGRPLALLTPEDRERFGLKPFANGSTISGSAVHWPLWISAPQEALPDAVMSVQAYQFNFYGCEHLAAMEWLALRAADAMRRHREANRVQAAIQVAELAAGRNRAVEDVRRFVALLDEIAALRDDPRRLLAEVRRRQVELTSWAPIAEPAQDALSDALSRLSQREIEVLVYVARGLSNKEVGDVLSLSEHTVKRHLDNVYRETPLRNRAEVAGACSTILVTHLGHRKNT